MKFVLITKITNDRNLFFYKAIIQFSCIANRLKYFCKPNFFRICIAIVINQSPWHAKQFNSVEVIKSIKNTTTTGILLKIFEGKNTLIWSEDLMNPQAGETAIRCLTHVDLITKTWLELGWLLMRENSSKAWSGFKFEEDARGKSSSWNPSSLGTTSIFVGICLFVDF